MRIAIGADHAGFELKEELKDQIVSLGHDVEDVGAFRYEALDDYPDFAAKVADEIVSNRVDRGVLICGSGIGASIAANKVVGIRAGICAEPYSGHQGVEHDAMNVVVIGSRITGIEVAKEIIASYLNAEFSGEDRHIRRLNKVLEIEQESLAGNHG